MKLCVCERASHNESKPSSKPRYAFRVVRMSKDLKPEAPGKERFETGAHGGVERDSAPGKCCQELGRPAEQHLRESDEAVVAMKRVTIAERRASA